MTISSHNNETMMQDADNLLDRALPDYIKKNNHSVFKGLVDFIDFYTTIPFDFNRWPFDPKNVISFYKHKTFQTKIKEALVNKGYVGDQLEMAHHYCDARAIMYGFRPGGFVDAFNHIKFITAFPKDTIPPKMRIGVIFMEVRYAIHYLSMAVDAPDIIACAHDSIFECITPIDHAIDLLKIVKGGIDSRSKQSEDWYHNNLGDFFEEIQITLSRLAGCRHLLYDKTTLFSLVKLFIKAAERLIKRDQTDADLRGKAKTTLDKPIIKLRELAEIVRNSPPNNVIYDKFISTKGNPCPTNDGMDGILRNNLKLLIFDVIQGKLRDEDQLEPLSLAIADAAIVYLTGASSSTSPALTPNQQMIGRSVETGAPQNLPLTLPDEAPELWELRANKAEDPISFMRRVYKDYLTTGVLYQFQLKKLDHKLQIAVKNYCQFHNLDIANILPPKKALRDKQVADIRARLGHIDTNELYRISQAMRLRNSRGGPK